MTLQDRLSEIEGRDNARHTIMQNDDIPKLVKALRVLDNALKCNETFHSLGGIDDCEPCLAKREAERILGAPNVENNR